jgi:hypothetical protein
MSIQEAMELLKTNGYRVSKPKAKAAKPLLNCLGLPMSANYDPNYRMQYKGPSMARLYAPQNFRWVQDKAEG